LTNRSPLSPAGATRLKRLDHRRERRREVGVGTAVDERELVRNMAPTSVRRPPGRRCRRRHWGTSRPRSCWARLLLDLLPHRHEATGELRNPEEEHRVVLGTGARGTALGGDRGALKPPQYASHGTTVARQGTCAASHVVLTGIVVSERGTRQDEVRPTIDQAWVTWTATFGSDCVSTSVISILYVVPPILMPLAK